jgi:hypothetical protein
VHLQQQDLFAHSLQFRLEFVLQVEGEGMNVECCNRQRCIASRKSQSA